MWSDVTDAGQPTTTIENQRTLSQQARFVELESHSVLAVSFDVPDLLNMFRP